MTKETYLVTLNRPEGVSITQMKAYIKDAVNSWNGQFEPPNIENNFEGDPLFNATECTVTRKTKP